MLRDISKYKVAVFGLGYVGLPLALGLAKALPHVYGFDVNTRRIEALKKCNDITGETSLEELSTTKLHFTADPQDLKDVDIFIVAVPTPITENKQPDLFFVNSAATTIAKIMKKGAIVVFESTVYPGVTEDICGALIEKTSGLKHGIDFHLGYSPERINPGDKEHTLENVIKIVAGDTAEITEILAAVYGTVVKAGIHKASSIRVAEAAKVIENAQRDLNVAFMNELAIIFEKIGIRTKDVLDAAGTKWNFLKFTPGLVGGHCIGVDPYYLTSMAETQGYHPQVILSGRRINDGMGAFVAQKTIKMMINQGHGIKAAKVGILGLTFKENVRDIRNSRVPDIIQELGQFGIIPLVHDPMADPAEAHEEYGLHLSDLETFQDLDALILAVPHRDYLSWTAQDYRRMIKSNGILIDIKAILSPDDFNSGAYWSL
jgi:UDP-N-acetyl-D-galactosamine dehydrogenase